MEIMQTMVCKVFAVILLMMLKMTSQVKAANNAYFNDTNQCLFNYWTRGPNAVLSAPVKCTGAQLCYGVGNQDPAKYVVCYNTLTKIPEFTAHIVKSNISGNTRSKWHNEHGQYAPNPQSSVKDYARVDQAGRYDNFSNNDKNDQFCSRGHLTPNGDFSTQAERDLTMVNTNIAPQWQPFNGGNWANLEDAVRRYATNKCRDLYVFTGTGGQATNSTGDDIILKNGIVAPKYYWKAICDPVAPAPPSANAHCGQSVVFVAKNNIGDIDAHSNETGCNGIQQTKMKGVIFCYSLQKAQAIYGGFKLPPFSANCNPSVRGSFMDTFLTTLNVESAALGVQRVLGVKSCSQQCKTSVIPTSPACHFAPMEFKIYLFITFFFYFV